MDKEVIQSVGFRNTVKDGKTTGFQLRVRLPYYRGVFLSQIRPGTLIVDGIRYEKEDICWKIKDEVYTYEQLKADRTTQWDVTEPATLLVRQEGGLSQGFHDITYGFCFTSSYMPPALQAALDPDQESFVFMPEFGHHVNSRRLIIV